MPIVPPSPSSDLGKELRKWEQHHTVLALTEDGDSQPGNPYVYRPFPAMLYRAELVNGKATVTEGLPQWSPLYPDEKAYERAILEAENGNKRRQKIVKSESEKLIARGQGWCDSPTEALERLEQQQQAISTAAAEANYAAQRMSESARAEWKDAGEATEHHVVDVTGSGKRRGRPKKITTGSGELES